MRLPEPIEAVQVSAKFDRERRGVILSVMADEYQRRIVLRLQHVQKLIGQLISAERTLRKAGSRAPRGQPPKP